MIGVSRDEGRVPVDIVVVPLLGLAYDSIAVEIDGHRVGYLEDNWVKSPSQGGILIHSAKAVDREVGFQAKGAICWNVKRGNPLKDDSVPIGVRLDLEDENALRQ